MIEYILARPFILLFTVFAILIYIIHSLFESYPCIIPDPKYLILILLVFIIISILRNTHLILSFSIVAILYSMIGIHFLKHHDLTKITYSNLNQDLVLKVKNSSMSDDGCTVVAEIMNSNYKSLITINIPIDLLPGTVYYGDTLQCKLNLIPVAASNSRFFNSYNSYLRNEHIYHKAKLLESNIVLNRNTKFKLLSCAQKIAANCKERFLKSIPDRTSANLMIALILGDKSNLDKSIKNDFINTGTAHILAVSGLHLGMIYGLLNFGIHLIRRKFHSGRKNFIQTLIAVLLIWCFAFISGLSTSVIRAAIMLSLFESGVLLKKNNDPVNSLFACGFIMLAFDPCTLFDIGFQLSFMAVLSIVLFNPYIRRLYNPEQNILCKLRDLIAVTLSVQILVTPISIYYFQQFPLYFIASNLIWIPLSFLLMTIGIALVTCSLLNAMLSVQLGKLCIYLCKAGLNSFDIINALPFTVAERLWIYKDQVLIYCFSSLMLYFWLRFKNSRHLIFSICLFLLIPSLQWIRTQYQKNSNSLILYAENLQLQSDFREGHVLYTTNLNSKVMKNYRTAYHIGKMHLLPNIQSLKAILAPYHLQFEVSADEICNKKESTRLGLRDLIKVTNLNKGNPISQIITYRKIESINNAHSTWNTQSNYDIYLKGPFIFNF